MATSSIHNGKEKRMSDLYLNFHGVDIEIEVTNYYGGDPGRTYGPPELCYPPEPAEIEFEISCELEEVAELLMNEYYSEIEELVLESYVPDEPDPDYRTYE